MIVSSVRLQVILANIKTKTARLSLQDPYANFVIQTALSVSSGQLHASLVEAIRPYLPSLRGTPFGKASGFFFHLATYILDD